MNHVSKFEVMCHGLYVLQVVLGFDGQKSVVASWMGLQKAQLVGQVAIRGMAVFPDAHKFEDKVYYTVGKGTRSGIVTMNDTKIYWFILWNDWGEGEVLTTENFILFLLYTFTLCDSSTSMHAED